MQLRRLLPIVLLLGFVPAAWGREAPKLTKNKVRSLLPAAAAGNAEAWRAIARLNATVMPEDAQYFPTLPLVVLVTSYEQVWPPVPTWGFERVPGLTTADFAKALCGGVLPGEAEGPPTLLRPEYIRSVTVEQDRAEARGVVKFVAKGAYEGAVHYEARYLGGAWTISAFAFPRRGLRIVQGEKGWRIDQMPYVPPLIVPAPIPLTDEPPPEASQASVYLTAAGDVHAGDEKWSLSSGGPEEQAAALAELEAWLREQAARSGEDAEGAARLHVVLVADARSRWQQASWIQQTCRTAGVHRFHCVGRSMATGKVGTVRTFLDPGSLPELNVKHGAAAAPAPREESGPTTVRMMRLHDSDRAHLGDAYTRVLIGPQQEFDLPGGWNGLEEEPGRRDAYDRVVADIQRAVSSQVGGLADAEGGAAGMISTPAPFGVAVPYEDVMQVVGVLRKAGVAHLRFEASPLPGAGTRPRR